ncbi:MAG: hypothetical protein ACYC8W_01880 [Candidatus Tyrphobacter sp.]
MIGSIILFHGVARADCGTHQLQADVPKLQTLERMPLTLENVYVAGGNKGPRYEHAETLPFAPTFVEACPDDPQPSQRVPSAIESLWLKAINFQSNLAVYGFVHSGSTDIPKACAGPYLAQQRFQLVETWQMGATGLMPDRAWAAALEKSPYFSHVHGMWLALAQQMGVRLPTLEQAPTNYATSLQGASAAAAAHLPDGITCNIPALY